MTVSQRQAPQGVGSPISNEAYNVITALQNKLEGMEAYRKYSQTGNSRLWQQLTEFDERAVSSLVDELERLVQSGEFRMRRPGQTG